MEKECIRIVIRMLLENSDNLNIEKIAKYTKLSIEEVKILDNKIRNIIDNTTEKDKQTMTKKEAHREIVINMINEEYSTIHIMRCVQNFSYDEIEEIREELKKKRIRGDKR